MFDVVAVADSHKSSQLNMRKICKMLQEVTAEQLRQFSEDNNITLQDAQKAVEYIHMIPQGKMRKKIQRTLEELRHSSLIECLTEGI